MFFIRKLTKIFIFIIVLTTYFSLLTSKASADNEFDTAYDITYHVNQDASVAVEHKITLTNKMPNIYISQYQVSLGTTRIRGVWVRIGSDYLSPQVERKENTTVIKIDFVDKVVGKGKALTFTMGYISNDYAMKNGRVLELGIPKVAENTDIIDYKAKLIVPAVFEDPVFILPQPTGVQKGKTDNTYVFDKEELAGKSITAAFGNYQVFNFQIQYHLENTNSDPIITEIALPPDTPSQKLYYDTLSPEPTAVRVDSDGNWLASYQISPKEKIEILATGSAEIFMNPNNNYPPETLNNLDRYLAARKFWEANAPEIKKLAGELKTVQNIYNYVVHNLIYDYGRVTERPQRLGALETLKNKESAICMEFTDLFIALCRAAGIPAREVNGFAYTNNPKLRPLSLKQDVLHAWPQYYDQEKKLWISVDPTWENTTTDIDFFHKLDLNHFAFVFHGQDSEIPLVAGSYKINDEEGKDVQISFGTKPKLNNNIAIAINLPKKVLAGLPINGKVVIKNLGNTALYKQSLTLTTPDTTTTEKNFTIDILTPFASLEQSVSLPPTNPFIGDTRTFAVRFNGQEQLANVEVYSLMPKVIGQFLTKIFSWLKLSK
jgi:transglutaminase-like putative cysteine protease